jgi:hypothetical protein
MSSFEIELPSAMAGYGRIDTAQIIADAAADAAGPDATPEEIGIELAKLIAMQLWEVKKPETVRRKFCTLWPIIQPLATTAPDSFDQILTEFAERANEFR